MLENLKTYVLALIFMVGLDGLWLGVITKSFYHKHLGFLFATEVTWWPIVVFYPIYALGITVFALMPSLEAESLIMAATRGALLGLVAYAAYDLTNQATIAKWPTAVTFADLLWGIVASTLVSVIVYSIMK